MNKKEMINKIFESEAYQKDKDFQMLMEIRGLESMNNDSLILIYNKYLETFRGVLNE